MTSVSAAAQLIADLVAGGVRDVVLSPGSRSAPLAYAAAAAEQAGVLRLHVRHDERAAAFLALGIGAAAPEHPAAVVTTSGTAVANLVPAALEADHGGVPLLLLTADRPVRARGTWASQTSHHQAGLFAQVARFAADVDVERLSDADQPWLTALLAARGERGRPGPAHVNLCFDTPLQPEPGESVELPEPHLVPEPRTTQWLPAAYEVPLGPRTVVVAGAGAGLEARALAEAAGWPLLAEPSSGSRGGPAAVAAYRLVLPHLAEQVERVVVYGRPTLSRPVNTLLERSDVEVVQVVRHREEPGPARDVTRVGAASVSGQDGTAWVRTWLGAGERAAVALRTAIAEWPVTTGLHVAAALPLQAGEALVLGASNAVRDVDLLLGGLPDGASVWSNRGVAGIDGTLSTAYGIAVATGRTTRVLVGDLTFLHDLAGLAVPAVEAGGVALQVVVANDDGGGIFETLEHRQHASAFERVFGTPLGASLGDLCAGYGVRHRLLEVDELASVGAVAPGVEVVEVATARTGLGQLHQHVAQEVARVLSA